MYGFLADFIVGVHVAYVAYVVLGQVVVMVGWPLGWNWIRNPWFRCTHLAAIGFVAFEEAIDMRCPLTVWEEHCRELAGQTVGGETFISRLMHNLIFVDLPSWGYTAVHVGMAVVVLATFIFCFPRFRKTRPIQV